MQREENINVNYFVIGLTVVVSFACHFNPQLLGKLLINPGTMFKNHEYWKLLSHAFVFPTRIVSMPFISLFFHLVFLWFAGSRIEQEFGSLNYVVVFLTSTLSAGLISLLLPSLFYTSVLLFGPGAALFCFLWLFSRINPDFEIRMLLMPAIKARYFLQFFIGFQLLISLIFSRATFRHNFFLILVELAGFGVAYLAHLLFNRNKDQQPKLAKHKEQIKAEAAEEGLEKENRTYFAALLGKKSEEPSATLKKQLDKDLNKEFNFEICPLSDFGNQDNYCLRCDAYRHCLAKEFLKK